MAKISLRGYIQKIEIMIDRGETDQAIFHCKSILKIYPKHIDSYRLLGKALLEKKKFGDAADIFQRVLSSVSDDFISQIGMSIIKEDENNLDAAIWHMERAFETQPSNKAVQEELRRLYTIRDGVAPPKIRLTRGALVRMYVKGELYTQATAEILAALSEDPNRIDLEEILARLYYLMDQKVEATEVCSKLITKLPYCYEANRILAEILPDTTRAEDAKIFHQRTVELDPYIDYVENSSSSSSDVPDDSVMLDYVEWDPSKIEHSQANWAESIGVSLSNSENIEEDEVEEWFNFDQSSDNEQPITNEIVPESNYINSDETIISDKTRTDLTELLNADDPEDSIIPDLSVEEENSKIPDWIKDAGWDAAEPENEESHKGFNLIDEDEQKNDEATNNEGDQAEEATNELTKEIEHGEIPEWLQEIAPVDQLQMLENENDGSANDEAFEKLFSQLSTSFENKPTNEDKDNSMDWLNEYEKEFPDSLSSGQSLPLTEDDDLLDLTLIGTQNIVDGIDQSGQFDELASIEANKDNEEKNSSFEKELTDVEQIETKVDVDETDQSKLKDSISSSPAIDSTLHESENDMAWLEALSENQDVQDSPVADIDSHKKEFPEWIKELDKETGESENIDSILSSSHTPVNVADSKSLELPDWLNINDQDQIDESELVEPEDLQINQFEDTNEQIPMNIIKSSSESSQWLSEMDQEISITDGEIENFVDENIGKESESVNPFKVQEEIIPEEQEEIETALSWMESLAEKHGAIKESLAGKSEFEEDEEEEDSPPEWVKSMSGINENDNNENDGENQQKHPEDQYDLTPDWLQALQIETNDIDDSTNYVKEYSETDLSNESGSSLKSIHTELISSNLDETELEQVSLNHNGFDDLTEEIDALINDQDQISELDLDQTDEKVDSIEEEVESISTEQISEYEDASIELGYSSQGIVDESINKIENKSSETKSEISEFSKERLDSAKQAIQKGKIDDALEVYNEFIHAEMVLDQVINDLQEVLNTQYPIEVALWQALGDAQLRNNQLQEALDSYSKAEELL